MNSLRSRNAWILAYLGKVIACAISCELVAVTFCAVSRPVENFCRQIVLVRNILQQSYPKDIWEKHCLRMILH